MTPMNPDWMSLKSQPFAQFIPDEVLQYRSDEIERIQQWAETHKVNLPAEVEIGSNRGCFLMGLARKRTISVVGIELKASLCRIAEHKLEREGLEDHAHVIHADAKIAIPVLFAPHTLDAIYVLFPDPWWKKRHARRRLLDDSFFEMAHIFLKPGGCFVLKTDVLDYFDAVDEYLQNTPCFERISIDEVPGRESWTLSTRERHCIEDNLPYKSLAIRNLSVDENTQMPRATLAEKSLVKHNYRYHPENS